MYVVCMYPDDSSHWVGWVRPWARASGSESAAAPGRGCTVIAAVTRTLTYVTLIAVQVEHWHSTWVFLMLFKLSLRMQLAFVFKIFWSFKFDWNWNVPVCCTAPLIAWQSYWQSQWGPSSVFRGRYLVHTCRYRQISWHTCRYRNIDSLRYMQIQMH